MNNSVLLKQLQVWDFRVRARSAHQEDIRAEMKKIDMAGMTVETANAVLEQGGPTAVAFLRCLYEAKGILPVVKASDKFTKTNVSLWMFDSGEYIADCTFLRILGV